MAKEGDKYIPNGVWLRCDKGATPGKLTILPKTVKLYSEDWAAQYEAVPYVNIPAFGACMITRVLCVPATIKWDDVKDDVTLIGQHPVLDISTCQCSVGGTIKIYFSRQAADDAGAEQDAKENAEFWGNVGKGLLIAGAVVGTIALVAATGGGALVVLAGAAATGAAIGGVGGAVAGGISGGTEGAVSGFFQGAAFGALGGLATATGAGVLAGALAVGAGVAGLTSLGFLGKAYYHNPSQENGLVLVGAAAGILAGGLTGRGVSRLQQMRANAKPPVPVAKPEPTLKQLADEAHALLGGGAKYKTTAIGQDAKGKLYIGSNDDLVPKSQRSWADKKGITPVRGKGHAEETIMNNVKDVKHIEASRGVCLDCERMMNANKVTTTTPKTGKRSKTDGIRFQPKKH